MPSLFTVSALGTGIALLEIVLALFGNKEKSMLFYFEKLFRVLVVILAALEAAVLMAFIAAAFGNPDAAASAKLLISGEYSVAFWALVVGCALVAPIVAALVGLFANKELKVASLVGAVCALVGGCALRFVVLYAGSHMDVVVAAVSSLLQ